ncbi:MAG: hypothetical protein E6J88_02260 [Deltaproteobacteria bacterium]|nr:MAG: hypothetical protein E6J88_02260 [Deltaproteobacteria bacterium]
MRRERRETRLVAPAQPRHRLGRKLQLQRLQPPAGVGGIENHRPGRRLLRRPPPRGFGRPPRQLRARFAEPLRQRRVGEHRADREQVEQQPARGVERRAAHFAGVDEKSASQHARGRRERDQREQQIRPARLEDQLGRAGPDRRLRRRLAIAHPQERLRQLVDRDQHPRFADARRDVDAVDLDAEHVENLRAGKSARRRQGAQLTHVGGIHAPRPPWLDADHGGETNFVDDFGATQ